MLSLSEFSPLIQLGATFCAAFVVIGYARSYAQILLDNVFFFKEHYRKEFDGILHSVDSVSLDSLRQDTTFNRDGHTLMIEDATNAENRLRGNVERIKLDIEKCVKEHCPISGFSFMCVFYFLFNLSLLLLIAIICLHPYKFQKFWMAMTILSASVFLAYWIGNIVINPSGKYVWKRKVHDILYHFLSQNANGLLLFAILSILAWAISLINIPKLAPFFNEIWTVIFIISVLLPFVNFLVCTIAVWLRIRSIRLKYDVKCDDIKREVSTLNAAITKLKNAKDVQAEAFERQKKKDEEEGNEQTERH